MDLAILIAEQLPRMPLIDIIAKVRDEKTWKSYLVCDSEKPMTVVGGCVVREHFDGQMGELYLMAVRTEGQNKGLGRLMIDELKTRHQKIVTFADFRALGFYKKMGFSPVL